MKSFKEYILEVSTAIDINTRKRYLANVVKSNISNNRPPVIGRKKTKFGKIPSNKKSGAGKKVKSLPAKIKAIIGTNL